MTNNELLLAISDMMDKKLKSEIQAELQPLKDDISHIKGDINYMKSDINHLNDDINSIKMHLENVTDKNI